MKPSTWSLVKSRIVVYLRRRWEAQDQLYHLRGIMMRDQRWLAHDPTSFALTSRYLPLLFDSWKSTDVVDTVKLRVDLGLVPNSSAENQYYGTAGMIAETVPPTVWQYQKYPTKQGWYWVLAIIGGQTVEPCTAIWDGLEWSVHNVLAYGTEIEDWQIAATPISSIGDFHG